MKLGTIGVAACAALIGCPAFAADMAVKAPPPPYNWTGFYIGGTAGGAWGSFDPTSSTVAVPVGEINADVPAINAAGMQSIAA